MTNAWIDFESYSTVNIKTAGGMAYARHDSTNAICLGWAVDNKPVNLWTPREPEPVELLDVISSGATVYAHNLKFDYRIWMYKMLEDFNWPKIELDQCVDTQALCATYGLPLSLDAAGAAMKIEMQKSATGKALIKLLCQPNEKGGQPMYNDPVYQARFREFFEYCKRDIDAMRELVTKRLPRMCLIPQEHKVWKLTHKMNTNGLPIAYDEVVAIRERLTQYIEQEMVKVPLYTKGVVNKITQTVKLAQWCRDNGYSIPNLTAATVEESLDDPSCPDNVRRVLELRQELGKSSVAKFTKLIEQAIPDKTGQYWVYDNLEFHGAGPGRWSGRGFQMHNLPRFKLKDPEPYIQKFLDGEEIENPVGIAKGLIRPMIKAPKDHKLFVLDYDSIENKVLHWLANDQETLTDFRNGVDQYKTMASARYRVAYEDVTKPQRQMGKVIILGCIAKDTLVLTNKGPVKIQNITLNHKVWDGESWVKHMGLLNQGIKECICVSGTWMTPDHKIYITDTTTKEAECLINQLEDTGRTLLESQAICLAHGKLLSIHRKDLQTKITAGIPSSAPYVKEFLSELLKRLKTETRIHVPHVLVQNIQLSLQALSLDDGLYYNILVKETSFLHTQGTLLNANAEKYILLLLRILNSVTLHNVLNVDKTQSQHSVDLEGTTSQQFLGSKIDSQVCALDAIVNIIETIISMEERGEQSFQSGERHITDLLTTLWGFQGMKTQSSKLTESITKETTSLETLDLVHNKKISRTVQTYDVLEAGSLHRFTILTPYGPMLVSNCGFGMGKDTFVTTAKMQFGMIVDEQEAADAIWAYREKYHLVKKLWNDLKTAAVRAVLTGQRQTVHLITFGLAVVNGISWLAMKLPSGKCVYYCTPKVEARHIPKFEHMGKVPTITHLGRHPKTGKWMRVPLIPGRLTENAVQGTAREVMAQGLLNTDERMPEMTLIGTVHDEGLGLVHERDITDDTLTKFGHCLCDIPWASTCPITASGYISNRYKKD